MQTILLELGDNKAFEERHNLEAEQLIRIVSENEVTSSYSLPGDPMSVEEFRKWIYLSEHTPSVSLTHAKKQWQNRKKKLQHFIK